MAANITLSGESLQIFDRLKSLIIYFDGLKIWAINSSDIGSVANAKLQHGASKAGHPRTYDIATSTKVRSRGEYRVSLVAYDETPKVAGKVEIESKVLARSAVKESLNKAMEDLLRKGQEELWT